MNCELCGKKIPAERLKVLPETNKCVHCATKHPDPPRHDPNELCAKASETARNGFAHED